MTDSIQQLKCPACQKLMKKVFNPKEGVSIDVCIDGCGGIYFDNREFKHFDEQDENVDSILQVIADKTFEPTDQSKTRTCPVCSASMVKNFSSAKHKIEIDECYSCGGKFLDAGELEVFRGEYATEAERGDDVFALISSTIGPEMAAMDAEHKYAMSHRSIMAKLFIR